MTRNLTAAHRQSGASQWPMCRLKTIAAIRPSNVDKLTDADEIPVRLCNYVDVYKNERITGDMEFMQATATRAQIERFGLQAGDVLITKDSETPDDIAVPAYVTASAEGVVCGYHLALLRPRRKCLDGSFLYWAICSRPAASAFSTRAQGITRFGLTISGIGDVALPVPPIETQQAIAAFLDRETAKIDGLIAKQTEFLTLLDEHRRALITEAVTRGLDPEVSMKATALEAFPWIPAHWGVKRLKYLAADVTVGVVVTPSKYYADTGVPALRSLNIRPMEIVRDDMVFFDEHSNRLLSKSMLRADDIVAVRTGKPGTTAVVSSDLDGANCIDLILVRRSPRIHSRFVAYTMNSDLAQAQFTEGSEGAIQQHFNIETAKNLLLPVPPMAEQIAISAALDARLATLDATRARSGDMIERLRERRNALITAAVTGQIDVLNDIGTERAA